MRGECELAEEACHSYDRRSYSTVNRAHNGRVERPPSGEAARVSPHLPSASRLIASFIATNPCFLGPSSERLKGRKG
jgi:hypothetical protein